MSDGPYRALPMPRPWKRFAAAVENVNFELPAVSARAEQALLDDWSESAPTVVGRVRTLFQSREGMLFPNDDARDLDALRAAANPSGAMTLFFDCAKEAILMGKSGDQGLIDAAATTLTLLRSKRFLQVEEHYLRTAPRVATDVRSRLAAVARTGDLSALARSALGIDVRAPRRVARATGLDDGVPR